MSYPEGSPKEKKEKCNLLLDLPKLTPEDVYAINWWLGGDLTRVQMGFLDKEWVREKARNYLSTWAPSALPAHRSFTLSTYRKLFGSNSYESYCLSEGVAQIGHKANLP